MLKPTAKIIATLAILTGICSATPPKQINFQGKLTDTTGIAVDDTLPMEFSLYTSDTATFPLWSETHTAVPVHHGLFEVILGSVNPFPDSLDFSRQYYLQIKVNSEILTPRIALNTVPYAMRAVFVDSVPASSINWDTLGAYYDTTNHFASQTHNHNLSALADVDTSGIAAGMVLKWDGSKWVVAADSTGADNDWQVSGSDMYSVPSGNVGIGTSSPAYKLDVWGSSRIRLYEPVSDKSIALRTDGGAVDIEASGANLYINGGDNIFLNPGSPGNVGIGTDSPDKKLEVAGDIQIESGGNIGLWLKNTSTSRQWFVGYDETGDYFYIDEYGIGRHLTIAHNGNVGIGTTSPAEKFSVGTSSRFQVNSDGDIVKIKGISYSFPSAQGAPGSFLKNDGSGNLSWETISIDPDNYIQNQDTLIQNASLRISGTGEFGTGIISGSAPEEVGTGNAVQPENGDIFAINGRILGRSVLASDVKWWEKDLTLCSDCWDSLVLDNGYVMTDIELWRDDRGFTYKDINTDGAYLGDMLIPESTFYATENISTDGENEWHESACPENYAITGVKFRIFEYYDGSTYHYLLRNLQARCTKIKIGTNSDESWGRQAPWVAVNNSYYNAWCPPGKVAVSITASNEGYGGGSADLDAKVYVRCRSVGYGGAKKSCSYDLRKGWNYQQGGQNER